MTESLKIVGWEKWQSYRRDRGQPPWIKIHRCLMRNIEWVSLTDSERGQLVAIWLLAADHDGVIPASPELLTKLCFMSSKININKFIDLGFVCQGGVNVASERRQHDAPETEADSREAEAESVCVNSIDLLIPDHLNKINDGFEISLAVDLWNEMAREHGLAQCQKLTDIRRAKLKKRLQDCGGIKGWKAALTKVSATPGLLGRAGSLWKASFDFMLQESSFTRLMEGTYDGWIGGNGEGPTGFAALLGGLND